VVTGEVEGVIGEAGGACVADWSGIGQEDGEDGGMDGEKGEGEGNGDRNRFFTRNVNLFSNSARESTVPSFDSYYGYAGIVLSVLVLSTILPGTSMNTI